MPRVYTKTSEWDRFKTKWIPYPGTRCWIWIGAINENGYGVFSDSDRKAWLANRASWELHNGPISDGMEVMHKCDRPACVNPDHLCLGTHADNMRDMKNKRRHSYGENRWKAKLTARQVAEIRCSKDTAAALAKMYGVSKPTIYMIVNNKTWRN